MKLVPERSRRGQFEEPTMPFPPSLLLAALALAAPPQPPAGQPTPAAYAKALGGYVQRLRATPAAPPGTVVIVTHGRRTLFARAYGMRDLRTGKPMTLDTPVYNASVTKAYTGLLAAMLDAEGKLRLDETIVDAWPGLSLPKGVDGRAVTIGRLLSHSAPINADGLVWRSVVTGEGVASADVPAHLSAYAAPREAKFEYSNSGPFLWSAMAEARTGMPWRDLLKRRILAPLAMRRSSARTEDFAPGEIATCHARAAGAWLPTPPKPTALMNAAGGMFTSGRDSARFVQLFATDGASERRRIAPALLRRTWQRQSVQDRDFNGMKRDGYGLGWDLGTFVGQRFVSRSGGYAGCRAMVLFLPQSGLGITVLTNGDTAANTHNVAIVAQAIDLWHGGAGAAARGEARIADYRRVAQAEVARVDQGHERLAEVRPLDPAWSAAAGRYRNGRLGSAEIRQSGGELGLSFGVSRGKLMWLGGDEFLATIEPDPAPELLRFERGPDGRPAAFVMDGDRFERVPG
jgi:CubicO group peptidase (beta-lactamase class C family)